MSGPDEEELFSHLAMVDVFGLICVANDAGLVTATQDRATMFAAVPISQRQPS